MNFQKITMTAAAAGLLLSSAVPALAYRSYHHRSSNDVEIEVENEDTTVENNVLTLSNTGLNFVDGGSNNVSRFSFGGHHHRRGTTSLTTGDAWAETTVYNDVNYTEISACDCLANRRGDVEIEVENDETDVTNNVLTVSNTGLNFVGERSRVRTGNAGAEAVVTNMVNTTIVQ